MRSPTLKSVMLILTLLAAGTAGSTWAGNLNPPVGPPAPTMKTLDEVEPRTPISMLPYTITQPGSYYLTRSLTASAASDLIFIQTSNVTLDLKGFTLDGGTTGQIGICACTSSALTNWVIRNGTLTNWFSSGISAGSVDGVRIEELTLINSGLQGMILGDHARVTDTFVTITGGTSSDGIGVGQQSIIDRCTVSGNFSSGTRGIITDNDSIVSRSSIKAFSTGVMAGLRNSVSHSIIEVHGSLGSGIDLQGYSTVEDNTIAGINQFAGTALRVHGRSNRIDGNHLVHFDLGIDFDALAFNTVAFHNSFTEVSVPVGGQVAGNSVAPIEGVSISMNPWANLYN